VTLRTSAIAAVAALAAALPAAALAAPFHGRCEIIDNDHNDLVYDFVDASSDGTFLPDAFAEKTFTKNGAVTVNNPQSSPLWSVAFTPDGMIANLWSRVDQGWRISYFTTKSPNSGQAALFSPANKVMGAGRCFTVAPEGASPAPVAPTAPFARPAQTPTGAAALSPNQFGGMTVPVSISGLPFSALVDTGNAFQLGLPRAVAEALVASGGGQWLDKKAASVLADGSERSERMIVVNSVVIAGRTAYGVEAVVADSPDSPVNVGLPLLNKMSGGKFSFDHGVLTFG
jgi:predicted aspartyl protease